MINKTILAQLSVQDFLLESNWQGQSPKFKVFSQPVSDTAQLLLNLEEFFSQNNWKGSSVSVQPKLTQTNKALSLTLSIQEYFQQNAWQSQPSVTVIPKYEAIPKPKTAQKFQVNDLSNLF